MSCDRDVALVVGQARGGADDLLARERRHHHGVPERHAGSVGQLDPVTGDLLERHPGACGDALLLQEHVQQLLAARQAADAEVADERLGGDEGQRHLLLQLGPAQLVGGVEQELIRRAEAARALCRADHDRAWVIEKLPPRGARPFGVTQRRDRLGVTIWAQARHDVELVAVAGGDHEVVVTIALAGGRVTVRAAGSIAVASACTKSIPCASKMGSSAKVISAALRLPNGSQISDGLNRNRSYATESVPRRSEEGSPSGRWRRS